MMALNDIKDREMMITGSSIRRVRERNIKKGQDDNKKRKKEKDKIKITTV